MGVASPWLRTIETRVAMDAQLDKTPLICMVALRRIIPNGAFCDRDKLDMLASPTWQVRALIMPRSRACVPRVFRSAACPITAAPTFGHAAPAGTCWHPLAPAGTR